MRIFYLSFICTLYLKLYFSPLPQSYSHCIKMKHKIPDVITSNVTSNHLRNNLKFKSQSITLLVVLLKTLMAILLVMIVQRRQESDHILSYFITRTPLISFLILIPSMHVFRTNPRKTRSCLRPLPNLHTSALFFSFFQNLHLQNNLLCPFSLSS